MGSAGTRMGIGQQVDAVIVKQPEVKVEVTLDGKKRYGVMRLANDGITFTYGEQAFTVRVVEINGHARFKSK